MIYPRRLLTEGEEVIREFRPHWRLLVFPFFWTLLFGAVIALTWNFAPDMEAFDWGVTALAIVAFLKLGFYPFISWWFTQYVLTSERLIRRSGVLARQGKEIPLENVTNLAFSQNILERVLRSGDLLIESAGEQGQQRFADIPDPEAFQSLVYKVREIRAREMQHGSSPRAMDDASVLERFSALLKQGLISQKDFDRKRQELLGDKKT